MKKTLLTRFAVIGVFSLLLAACNKDYITGGSIEDLNKHINISTYDVLKSIEVGI